MALFTSAQVMGSVYALQASNGSLLWSYKTNGGVYAPPTLGNGIVYIGSEMVNSTHFKHPTVHPFGMTKLTRQSIQGQL